MLLFGGEGLLYPECNKGWPWFLIILFLYPLGLEMCYQSCWIQAGRWTQQGFVHAVQALYQLSYIPSCVLIKAFWYSRYWSKIKLSLFPQQTDLTVQLKKLPESSGQLKTLQIRLSGASCSSIQSFIHTFTDELTLSLLAQKNSQYSHADGTPQPVCREEGWKDVEEQQQRGA